MIRQPRPRLPNPRPRWATTLLLTSLLAITAWFEGGCSTVGGSVRPFPPSSPSPTPPPTSTPPLITANPASETVTVGQSGAFVVNATGGAPLSYQWQKNGVVVAGATSSTYTTAPAQITDDGSIFVAVVSNAAGSLMSTPAMLTVIPGTSLLTADAANVLVQPEMER